MITDSTQTDKWVAALTNRNTYLPLHAGTFDFTPSVIRASQMAHFAVTAHWVATNGLMVAQVNGLSTGNFVGAPSLGIYYDGYAENILGLNPSELAVLWAGTLDPSSRLRFYHAGRGQPAVQRPVRRASWTRTSP